MKAFLFLVSVWTSSFQGSVTPVILEESLDTHYYEVTGLTPQHLLASFRRRPNPSVMATTEAGLSIRYDFAFGNGECRLMQARIEMEIDITYPRWREEAQASEAMQSEWQRFMTALEQHEEGHVTRFRDQAERLSERLSNIPPQPDCGRIRAAVDFARAQFDRDVERIQRNYETETGYGRSQGALLRFR